MQHEYQVKILERVSKKTIVNLARYPRGKWARAERVCALRVTDASLSISKMTVDFVKVVGKESAPRTRMTTIPLTHSRIRHVMPPLPPTAADRYCEE